MTPTIVGIVALCFLMLMIASGIPIAFSLAAIGILGTVFLEGIETGLAQVSMVAWDTGTSFIMVCAPLFVLMGQLVNASRIAEDLYDCVQKWFGRIHGGLAITSVIACAGFAAITGVSVAAVAAIGSMVLPQMKKYNYDPKLATGALSTAGTLAILIPPSLGFVVYGFLTDTSIAALFLAGIIPAIILTVAFALYIYIRCRLNPTLGPPGPKYSWGERIRSLVKLLPVAGIFILVIGGIYGGLFTPTEAAGIGVVGVLIIGLCMKRYTIGKIAEALETTATLSAMIYPIMLGGFLIGRFLILTDITNDLVDLISHMEANRYLIIMIFIAMYLVLGAILDVWGMMILTIPFVFPVIVELGFHPVWFGVFITLMVELALVTPPIGVCVYVINELDPSVRLTDVFRGIVPFTIIILAFVVVLVFFPELALWLPSQ